MTPCSVSILFSLDNLSDHLRSYFHTVVWRVWRRLLCNPVRFPCDPYNATEAGEGYDPPFLRVQRAEGERKEKTCRVVLHGTNQAGTAQL